MSNCSSTARVGFSSQFSSGPTKRSAAERVASENPYAIAPKASLTAPMANGASTAEAHVKKRMTPAAAPCSDSGSSVRLFDPVAYTASLLCIVTACTCAALIPALRAGRINPVGALRQD